MTFKDPQSHLMPLRLTNVAMLLRKQHPINLGYLIQHQNVSLGIYWQV